MQALTFVRGAAALLGPPIAGVALDRLHTVVRSLFFVLCLCFLSKQIVNKFYFLLVFLAGGSVHIVHDLPGHIHNNPPGSLAPSKVGSPTNIQNNDQ